MHSVARDNVAYHLKSEEESELRRGPWTLEEDTLLIHYIARNGEGHWNLLAKRAGLKRTGKSCRLRWLNYLKPDIKRGNLTPQEQLLILELHSKWGNRWSKIAQHLPGRTDNEIKNYWRTRVQKQARQLNIESEGKGFADAMRCFWMPRLLQKVEQSSSTHCNSSTSLSTTVSNISSHENCAMFSLRNSDDLPESLVPSDSSSSIINSQNKPIPFSSHPKGCLNSFRNQNYFCQDSVLSYTPENIEQPKPSNISHCYAFDKAHDQMTSDDVPMDCIESCFGNYVDMKISEYGIEGLNLDPFSEVGVNIDISGVDYPVAAGDWTLDGEACDPFWNMGEI